MSYGYGLGVYWSDYNDPPDESDFDYCTNCNEHIDNCECEPVSIIKVNCDGCGKEIETMDEGQFTDVTCYQCKPKPDPNWEPEF